MKKFLIILIILCSGCVVEETSSTTQNDEKQRGKCLEYETEYRLDCGLFVDSDSFCKERKYDVCIRWEEISTEANDENSK